MSTTCEVRHLFIQSNLVSLAADFVCPAGSFCRGLQLKFADSAQVPLSGMAVYLEATAATPQVAEGASERELVMDQQDLRFQPEILVIRRGSSVDFPNHDTVSHHVYSFSAGNAFELPLYRGDANRPVKFSTAGLVIMGCNIHDSMIGYILVVDSPWYGVTDVNGQLSMQNLPLGKYRVYAWSPRSGWDQPEEVAQVLVDADSADQRFLLEGLNAEPAEKSTGSDSLLWNDY